MALMDFWEGPGSDCTAQPHQQDEHLDASQTKPLTCNNATLLFDYTTAARHGRAQAGCNGKVLSVSCRPVPTEGTAGARSAASAFPL